MALLAGPLLSAGSSPASAVATTVDRTASAPTVKLTVRMYNYARMTLHRSAVQKKVAEAIFESGIQASGWNCPLSDQKSSAHPACESADGNVDIVLRILPRHMANKLRRHNTRWFRPDMLRK